jgi:predicted enzyme related to lactoylglutathione lyase
MSTKKAAKKKSPKRTAKKAPSKPAGKGARKAARKAPKKSAASKPAAKASNSASSEVNMLGQFNWNELMTSDANAATEFYTQLFGWKPKPFGEGMDYTILENNGKGAAGLMKSPEGGPPPMWLAYVSVKDINASVARLTQLGGKVCKGPFPIPGVGQIAIVLDPQGAMFGLHSCEGA